MSGSSHERPDPARSGNSALSSESPETIETLVFDVGKVLVDFDFDLFVTFLKDHGATVKSTDEFIERTQLLDYEHGQLSDSEFLANVLALLEREVDTAELTARWQQVFTPLPDMLSLLELAKTRYRVFLLSNTNTLHWSFLEQSFRLNERSHGAMTSFRAGAMKPSKAIFEAASKLFDLSPRRTVFIDDIAGHVAAAQSLGWNAVQHLSYERTLHALKELGVDLAK